MTEYEYIIDSTSLKERYDRIQSIITALENQQIAAAGNVDVLSYSLDDGQTRISTQYRSSDQIARAIEKYERILNRIQDQLTGTRVIRLADAKTVQSSKRII